MKKMPQAEAKIVREENLADLMRWRMQKDVTRFLNTDPVLTMEGQKQWFESISAQKPLYHWVVYVDGVPAGNININYIDGNECEWGYYIAEKNARSLMLSVSLELSLYDFIFSHTNVNTIYARTFTENASVVRLHELCGCQTQEVLPAHVHKNGQAFDVCVQVMTRAHFDETEDSLPEYEHIVFETEDEK